MNQNNNHMKLFKNIEKVVKYTAIIGIGTLLTAGACSKINNKEISTNNNYNPKSHLSETISPKDYQYTLVGLLEKYSDQYPEKEITVEQVLKANQKFYNPNTGTFERYRTHLE